MKLLSLKKKLKRFLATIKARTSDHNAINPETGSYFLESELTPNAKLNLIKDRRAMRGLTASLMMQHAGDEEMEAVIREFTLKNFR